MNKKESTGKNKEKPSLKEAQEIIDMIKNLVN